LGLACGALLAVSAQITHAREPDLECRDDIQNGPESDVDCGGDCAGCAPSKRCIVPTDCASGRCADGRCQERVLGPREGIPEGYTTRRSRHDAAATARRGGWVFLGATFVMSYVAAAIDPGRLGELYAPVVGPWLVLDDVSSKGAKAAWIANGALQAGGALLLAGGYLGAKRQLIRVPDDHDGEKSLEIAAGPRVLPSLLFSARGVELGVECAF
jgi:hypothetical protein